MPPRARKPKAVDAPPAAEPELYTIRFVRSVMDVKRGSEMRLPWSPWLAKLAEQGAIVVL